MFNILAHVMICTHTLHETYCYYYYCYYSLVSKVQGPFSFFFQKQNLMKQTLGIPYTLVLQMLSHVFTGGIQLAHKGRLRPTTMVHAS